MSRESDRVGAINLGQGLSDLPTLDLVAEGARRAIAEHKSTYTYPEGILPLRQAISKKLERDNQIQADPEGEIVVTAGATAAFAATVTALLKVKVCGRY